MLQLDLRGRPCPEPVLEVRKALMEHSELEVLLDSTTSVANVSRLARSSACSIEEVERGDHSLLILRREDKAEAQSTPSVTETREADAAVQQGPHVLVLSADTMGRGDDELGHVLMRAFVSTLREFDPLPARIILYNSAVKLAVQDSAALKDLQELVERGVDLLACGTCLKHFALTEQLAVGRVSNMYEIAGELIGAARLSSL